MFIDINARENVIHPDDLDKPEGDRRRITLRRQLNQRQRSIIMDAALKMDVDTGGKEARHVAVGSFSLALLEQYVTGWEGPGFPKFDPDMIVNLDADDPLVKAASERAANLWKSGQNTDPKG